MSKTQVFFAAQGVSYEIQRNGGYLWAPKKNKSGAPMFYWENLTHVEAGNIIIHYSRGNFRAVSEVHAQLTNNGWQGFDDAIMPKELPDFREEEGWLVKCEYFDFSEPIPLETFHDIIMQHRSEKYSAFDRSGLVNQGYLYHLEPEIAEAVLRKAISNQPELRDLDYIIEFLNG